MVDSISSVRVMSTVRQSGSNQTTRQDLRKSLVGSDNGSILNWSWTVIDSENCSEVRQPCCRSLHATAVHDKCFYVFGGYDGTNRRNDLYKFNIETS
mmetsp:Transcript_106226/g.147022  ORF Transcript_106226/g.147022 Transcript_106226/m.147022 type:complete len:97 (-) Transcript_106226:1409-1699(-)